MCSRYETIKVSKLIRSGAVRERKEITSGETDAVRNGDRKPRLFRTGVSGKGVGGTREDVPDILLVIPLEKGEKLVSDAVSDDARVTVRPVDPEGDPFFLEERDKVVFSDVEEWTDDVTVHRADSRQSVGSCAAEKPEKHGLRLVVFRVCGRDTVEPGPFPRSFEESVPDVAEPFLVFSDGVLRMKRAKRNPVSFAESRDEALVLLRIFATKTVIHMRGGDPESETIAQRDEHTEKRGRIRTAGKSDKNLRSIREQEFKVPPVRHPFQEFSSDGGGEVPMRIVPG